MDVRVALVASFIALWRDSEELKNPRTMTNKMSAFNRLAYWKKELENHQA